MNTTVRQRKTNRASGRPSRRFLPTEVAAQRSENDRVSVPTRSVRFRGHYVRDDLTGEAFGLPCPLHCTDREGKHSERARAPDPTTSGGKRLDCCACGSGSWSRSALLPAPGWEQSGARDRVEDDPVQTLWGQGVALRRSRGVDSRDVRPPLLRSSPHAAQRDRTSSRTFVRSGVS
jgi:hypothetical protein